MGNVCCEEDDEKNVVEDGCDFKNIYYPREIEKKNEIDKLTNNLTGVTKEYTAKDLNPDSSKSSSFNSSNEDHFEINIRYDHQEIKLKVKKKYTVSKVITKFIELEKPKEVQGRLLLEGDPLEFTKTLGELGISENDTLDIV